MKIITILLIALALSSCEPPRECIKSHRGTRLVMIGKAFLPQTYDICDEYAPLQELNK